MTMTTMMPSLLASFLMAGPQIKDVTPYLFDAYDSETVSLEDGKLMLTSQLVFAEGSSAANRIVAGGFLRTLSQEIAAASCYLHHGVSVDEASELLAYSAAKFDAITVALLNGDEAMGIIGGETRPKTIAHLQGLIETWVPVREAAISLLQEPTNLEAVDVVYVAADQLYEDSYVFLSKLEAQYANPTELLFSDMLLLEISARMAAMTQRIAYESCRVWSGDGTEKNRTDLVEAKDIFRNSLLALSNGEPSMGILPAPTEEIAEALKVVGEDWAIIEAYMKTSIDGGVLDQAAREDLYTRLIDKLYKVEAIEVMYQEYSQRI